MLVCERARARDGKLTIWHIIVESIMDGSESTNSEKNATLFTAHRVQIQLRLKLYAAFNFPID